MRKAIDISFSNITSGYDFETYIVELLKSLRFRANRVGKNDCGVDILANIKISGQPYHFYIQCKYYNKPVGKAPIQEIFAGTAYNKDCGTPVVITNNHMTFEDRNYARSLGVEVIAAPEWTEFKEILKAGKVNNPNQHTGLLGMMVAIALDDPNYLTNALPAEVKDKEKMWNRKEMKLQIMSDMGEAEECIKEYARLQQQVARYH